MYHNSRDSKGRFCKLSKTSKSTVTKGYHDIRAKTGRFCRKSKTSVKTHTKSDDLGHFAKR